MTVETTITGTCLDGKPLEVLGDLVAKRQQYLRETTEQAVTATAINVVTSLRSATKKAPLKAKDDMFSVELVAPGGWRGARGARRRVALRAGHEIRDVHPVNAMYQLKGGGDLYKITILNEKIRPSISLNKPYYYVLAPTAKVATDYARARVTRALRKESGMAKYALGIAQAKTSNRPMKSEAPTGAKQMQTAYAAAKIDKWGGGGEFGIRVFDALNYSVSALKGGEATMNEAMQKAANRTAGIINHCAGYRLDAPIPTPFPEAKK